MHRRMRRTTVKRSMMWTRLSQRGRAVNWSIWNDETQLSDVARTVSGRFGVTKNPRVRRSSRFFVILTKNPDASNARPIFCHPPCSPRWQRPARRRLLPYQARNLCLRPLFRRATIFVLAGLMPMRSSPLCLYALPPVPEAPEVGIRRTAFFIFILLFYSAGPVHQRTERSGAYAPPAAQETDRPPTCRQGRRATQGQGQANAPRHCRRGQT